MTRSLTFVRFLYLLLALIFMNAYAVSASISLSTWGYVWGSGLGIIGIGLLLFCLDQIFKRFSLRTFNVTLLGLFFGYLLGQALTMIFNAILQIAPLHPNVHILEFVKTFLFLTGTYLGVIITLRSSHELTISLPFIKFSSTQLKPRAIVLDTSILMDPRLIDLANSGLLDKRAVLPRFVLKSLYQEEESHDEYLSARAKRAIEMIHQLSSLPTLELEHHDMDFPEVKTLYDKIVCFARFLDADLLTADPQQPHLENVRVINIHTLACALKPLMQKGQILKIKIQRQGKEELQGVGYLDDGTMVVINGGGEYLGETISATILSVKHTASGRMIFCNVAEEECCVYGA